jgi:hypothetical protein
MSNVLLLDGASTHVNCSRQTSGAGRSLDQSGCAAAAPSAVRHVERQTRL